METLNGDALKRFAWAEISLTAIEQNIKTLKGLLAPGCKFCAVVKADAYGHGALAVAQTALAAGADYLAVATFDEGLNLRQSGFLCPILILGHSPQDMACLIVENDLSQTVFNLKSAQSLDQAARLLGKKAKIHLKINTGMNRLGVEPSEALSIAAEIYSLGHIEFEGVFSHLATSDSPACPHAHEQINVFTALMESFQAAGLKLPLRHLANSAGLIAWPQSHFDMVRAGIALYGLWPSLEMEQKITLVPALSLKARIVQLRQVPIGTPLSYGASYVTQRASLIGTLPLGYADGLPRNLSNQGYVMLGQRAAPIVGRICMDQCLIDVTGLEEAKEGAEITLFGPQTLTADDVAQQLGTINYEIVTRLGARLPRIYLR